MVLYEKWFEHLGSICYVLGIIGIYLYSILDIIKIWTVIILKNKYWKKDNIEGSYYIFSIMNQLLGNFDIMVNSIIPWISKYLLKN